MPTTKLERFTKPGTLAIAKKAWGHEFEILMAIESGEAPPPFLMYGPYAVVEIKGPLVNRKHVFWDSYEAIRERVDAALDYTEAKAVVLRINSPGGDVDGCFEAARELRAMARRHGKRMIAFADGMAASAAYALASAAEEIVVPPTGFVGSIGIIEALCEQTARDAAEGFHFEFLTSGERKADGNPHIPITDGAKANLQNQVDGLADLFFALVRDHRGLPVEKVRKLEAGMFFGARALDVGLADALSTWAELIGRSVDAPPTNKEATMPQAMSYADALANLEDVSKGEDEDAKKAKRALKMIEEGDPDSGAPPEKKQDGKKGEGEDKKPGAEGEDEDEDKKPGADAEDEDEDRSVGASAEGEDEDESEDEAKKRAKAAVAAAKKAEDESDAAAQAAAEDESDADAKKKAKALRAKAARLKAAAVLATRRVKAVRARQAQHALAERVHKLEAERASERDAQVRDELLAQRPDFSAEVAKTLREGPIELLRKAVKDWPRIAREGRPLTRAAAASAAGGTRGATQTGNPADVSTLPREEQEHIDRHMGFSALAGGTRHDGNHLVLGPMSAEAAQKRLAELEDQMKKGAL